jgi:hypothetical protein
MRDLDSKHIVGTDREPYLLIGCVYAAIEWANDPEIGGDVDALMLHRGGRIEWLQEKKNCPGDNFPLLIDHCSKG